MANKINTDNCKNSDFEKGTILLFNREYIGNHIMVRFKQTNHYVVFNYYFYIIVEYEHCIRRNGKI